MGSVQHADALAQLVRGMSGCPVDMVLIARLTRGMAAAAGEAAAALLVVVDAIDERALNFYRCCGFVSTLEGSRLCRRMKDIRASLEHTQRRSLTSKARSSVLTLTASR